MEHKINRTAIFGLLISLFLAIFGIYGIIVSLEYSVTVFFIALFGVFGSLSFCYEKSWKKILLGILSSGALLAAVGWQVLSISSVYFAGILILVLAVYVLTFIWKVYGSVKSDPNLGGR